ncbi:5-methylcytosine-specific restriction endonuclease McrA [Pseudomonas sp. JAI115]|uniref:Ig-like domain-containing protein n=1 Tax=Pseudomonas sp. JAI115 TaxID=2723061 RepID=UPI00161D08F0|nr:Ig-like domain-containing protein [Pseudomonas sp. JAI115]MBB6155241.1 5-methylcytosine-specific restriction endonuclease McrA [Pseudomonas sp. JAI115]
MKAVITVINKTTRASSTVFGLHAALAEPSVVQLSVNSVKDIASLARQGDALVISMRSGEVFTVDDFYLLHKGVKNTLVIQDAQGELLTPAVDAAGQPVLDTASFVHIDSIEPLLLDGTNPEFNGWWLAGAGLLAGGLALAGGGGGGGGHSAPAATDHTPTATAHINAISTDSGVAGDFTTNDATLVVTTAISGPLAAGEKVQISLDGGATWHDATSIGGNLYAYDNTAQVLADGTYVFESRIVSAAGTPGAVSTQVVVIDTVAPTVAQSLSIAGISDDTGSSNSDFITSDHTLVIRGNLGAPLGAGERVEISLDGGVTWSTVTVSGTTWSFDNTANLLADGTYTLQARVIDAAGNVGQVASHSLLLSSAADNVIISFSSISPDTGISSVDYVTNGTKITFLGTLTAPLDANNTVQISLDGGVTWEQAIVNGTHWEYDPMLDGTYHIMARVIDLAGNIGSTASIDLVVDTTVPVVSSSGSSLVANPDGSLSLSGGAGTAEPGSIVTVQFPDGSSGTGVVGSDGSYGPITSALGQPAGPTSMTLTDIAGNVSAPASLPYPDTTPPTATAMISAISDDTGASGSDFVTNDSTLSISAQLTGSLGAGEKVQISLDGGATWHDAVLQGGSTYVYDNTANPLAAGTYTVQARVVDMAGNASAVSSQSVTIDTQPGSGNSIALTAISQDTGASSSDFHTSDHTLVFFGSLGAALAADEAAQISLDGGATWQNVVVSGTSWTFDNTATAIPDGTVGVQVRIVDLAGNVAATASATLVVDSLAPAAASVSLDAITTDTGSDAHDFATQDHTLVFSGPLSAALSGDEMVQISLDGGASWQTANVTGTSWSFDNSATVLADGSYTVQVRVTDLAGNLGASSTQLVVIDSAIPAQTATLDSISTDSGVAGDFITNDNTLIFNGSLSGALPAGSSVEISLDGGSTWVTASVAGLSWSYDASGAPLADGNHVVQVRVTDTAGNSSAAVTQGVSIDTSGPVTSLPSFDGITVDSGVSSTDFVTMDRTLVFSGSLTAPLASDETLQFSLDGGLTWSATTVSGTSWVYDNTSVSLVDGSYLAQLRVVDTAGNVGATAAQMVQIAASVAPTATVAISGITTDTGSSASDFVTSDQSLIFSLTLSGTLNAGESVQVSLDGGTTWQMASLVSGSTYTYDHTATQLGDGVYNLLARVTDTAGNTSAAGSQVLVIDASAPSTGNAVAIVSYTDSVVQNTGTFGAVTPTNDPAPVLNGTVSGLSAGDVLQVFEGTTLLGLATVSGGTWSYALAATTDGTHTYHVVIVDAAGNSGTVSSDFSLSLDTLPPSNAITMGPITISVDSGTVGDFITNDNTLVFSGTLGAPLGTGESVQISLDGGANWLTVSSSLNTWSFDHTATTLPDNTYNVQARVIDDAGNVGQSTSQVVVVDTQTPNANITVDIIGISLDTGSNGSDYNTADNTLLFLGNIGLPLGIGQRVEISLDGGTSWATVTMTGATEWQYDNTANTMPDDTYTVVARVIDTAGNVGQTDTQIIQINSQAPVGNSIEILAISPDSGSPTDFFTNTGVLSFSGIITAPLSVGGAVEVSLDNGLSWFAATVTGTSWTFDNTAQNLVDGTYNLQARIVDMFGNVEQTATEVIKVDTVAPSATATVAITAISNDTGVAGDFITSDNTLIISGTLGDVLQSGEGVRVSLDGGTSWSIATVTGTSWSIDLTGTPLPDATYTLLAETFDLVGNVGQNATRTITVDTSLPSASVTISGISTDSATPSDFITSDQTLVVSTTLTGSLNAGETVQISLDNGANWHDATQVGGFYVYDNTANTLAEGTYTFLTRVVDAAGSASASASQTVIIDASGPSTGYTVTLDSYTDNAPSQTGDFASGTSTNDTTPLLQGTVTGLISGDTVQIYEGSTFLGLATLSGNTWQYQLGTTSEGGHTYQAILVDAPGNAGLSSSAFSLTIDTQMPSSLTTINITAIDGDSGTSGDFNTNDNTLVFSGTLSQALVGDERVELSLDGGVSYHLATVVGTTWTYDHTATPLLDSTYNLMARVVDAAGNEGQTDTQALVIDTAAPLATQTIAFTSISSDTGVNGADFVTSDPTLIFNGTLGASLQSGESVEVQINGGGWLPATVSGLSWTLDHTGTTLNEGDYTVQARVVDIAGNVGQSASQVVTVDTSVPTVTVAITGTTDNTGAINDFTTSDPTLVFSGTLSAALGAGEQVYFSYDGGTSFALATVSGTSWSFDNRGQVLGEGTHSLQARVVDAAGNFVDSAIQSLTIDTVAPMTTIAFGAISDDTGVATDYITSDPTLTFSGTLSAALASDERVEISLDGGTSWATASVTGTAWSFDNTTQTLSNGSHNLIIRVIDAADNVGNSAIKTLVVDTQVPTPTLTIDSISTDTGLDTGASLHDFITFDDTLLFTGSLSTALVGDEFVQISFDGGTSWTLASASGTTWTYNHTGAGNEMAPGNYTVLVRVMDAAGNIGPESSQALVIDRTAPSETLTLTGISTDSGTLGDFTTQDNTLIFSGAVSSALTGDSVVQVRIDGGQWQTATVIGTSWSFDNSAATLSDGSHTVQARVVDAAGNSTSSVTQAVIVDTTPPLLSTVPLFGGITLDLGISGTDFVTRDHSLIYNGTLTAPLASDEHLQFSIDGGAHWDTITNVSGTAWSYDRTTLPLSNGTYTALLQVVDDAGNVGATASKTVVIYDVVPVATVSITGITDNTGSTADFVTGDQTLVFSLTLVGSLGADQFVQISLDGGNSWNNAVLSSGSTYVFDNSANTLPEGTYALQARVFDVAGNSSPVAGVTLQIDISAPTSGNAVAISSYTDDVLLNTGNFGAGTQTNDTAPVLNGTVSGLSDGDVVLVFEGTTLLGTATVTGGTWTYQLSGLSDSSHTYHAVIADAAGNTGTASSDFGLTVFTQMPSATTTIDITGITDDSGTLGDFITNDTNLVFSGVLGAQLLAGESVEVRVDGGNWGAATITGAGTTWAFDYTGTTLSNATHTVEARVVNAAGNIGQTDSQAVQVDTVAPSASTTVNIIGISLDTGASGSDFLTADNTLIFLGNIGSPLSAGEYVEISIDGINWDRVTMTGPTEWNYNNESNVLPNDIYTVQARVVDAAGNVGQTDSQLVEINNTIPVGNSIEISTISPDSGSPTDFFTNDPKLTFYGIITSPLDVGGHVELSFDNGLTWSNAVVTGTNWTFDNTANSLPEGSQIVMARITDVFGNVEQTAQEEIRIDTQAPSATTTVAITGITDDTGTAGDFVTSDDRLIFSGTLGAPLQTATSLQTAESVRVSLDNGATWHTASVTGTNWTYDHTGTQLPSGTYTLLVQVVDLVGNIGESASRGFTVDTTTPSATAAISAITTDSGTAGDFLTNDQSLVVTATLTGSLGAGQSVEISVDNGANWHTAISIGSNQYTYDHTGTTLGEATYTFLARVINAAGTASAVASQNVTIDITGPTVGYTLSLNTFTDDVFALTGDFASGTSTNDTTPRLNGTVTGLASGDTVAVYEGSTRLGLATVAGSTWKYILATVAEGSHTYHAVVVDAAGNIGLASPDLSLIVDTQAPGAAKTITFGALNSDSGVTTDYITNDNTLIFSGTLGATLAADEHVEFSFDGGSTYATATHTGLTWTYDYSGQTLNDAIYNLKVRVVDAAGNAGQSANKVLEVDTSAPDATKTIAFNSITNDTGVSATDFITNDKGLFFNGTLGAALNMGESVEIRFDNGIWRAASNSGLTWSFDYTATDLSEGVHTVDVRVVDTAGNVGQNATKQVTIDLTAPTATIQITSITDNTGATTDFTTSDQNLMFGGTLSAALGSGERVEFSYDGTNYNDAVVSGTNWTYDATGVTLGQGDHFLKARVVDAAGNYVNTANQTLTVDFAAPTQTITIGSISTDTGVNGDFITSDTTLTFTGTLGAILGAGERVEISFNNGTSWTTVTSVTGTTWTHIATLTEASYPVVVRVIDLADNVGLTANRTVVVDTTAPTATVAISAISDDNGISATDFITNDQTLLIDVTLTGTLGAGEGIQVSTDNGSSWLATTATLVSGNTYRVDNTGTTLGAATYNLRARVVDLAGNAGTVSAAQAVTIDITAPTVTAITLTAVTTDTTAGLTTGTGSTTDSAVNTDFNTRDTFLTVSGGYTGTLNTATELLQISTDGTTWINVPTANINTTSKTWTYTDPTQRTSATTYQLRVIDTAGNVAAGAASQVINIDITAPSIAALLAPVLTSAFDSGVVGDNITTNTSITFTSATSGLGEVGSTIVLVNDVDNDGVYSQGIDTILGSTTVAAGGAWSLSTSGLAVGGYHLVFMGVDTAGNRSVLTANTHLRVVGSDLSSQLTVSGFVGVIAFEAVKLDHNGLWNIYRPGQQSASSWEVEVQTSLTSVTVAGNGISQGTFTSIAYADFERSGYSGLIAVGVNPSAIFKMMRTTSNTLYSDAGLTGNARSGGGIVVYDHFGDGWLDFAMGDSNAASLTFASNNAGSVIWMNGTSSSGGRPTGTAGINSYAEASAVDLNNNGTVDIVEHTNGNGNFALTTFLNTQSPNTFILSHLSGVFSTAPTIPMTWADFNNDGYMDLFLGRGRNAANTSDTSASRIYWNNQSGGFGTAAGTTGGTATYFSDSVAGNESLAIDWNHDGKMDVVEFAASGSSQLYLNQGGGSFTLTSFASTGSNHLGAVLMDFNWDGAQDVVQYVYALGVSNPVMLNNNAVADGASLHLQIFDHQGLNVFYANTVQLYNSSGALVSSQIINPQSGMNTNESSALVYFYGLSAAETYTAVLLKSVSGVSSDVSGVNTLGGNTIENVNATWTGLTTGLATHNYVLSAESGSNSANGKFIGTGYNDHFFATAGTDTFVGGGGWLTHYGTPSWNISRGEDVLDFKLADTTAVTVNLNTTTAQSTGFGTVTLTGIEGIIGGGGNDNLTASTTAGANNFFDGRGGNDTYTMTGGGHTLLTFTNLNNSDATGGNGSDTAIGFGLGNVNSVAAADAIDLSALLTGYTGTAYVYTDTTTSKPVLDKASEGLMNYLNVTNNGTNTSISIDRDGTGSTFAPTLVLTLNNVATDMETLLVNHQLIV